MTLYVQFIPGDMQQGSGSVDPTSNLWSKGSDFSNLSLSTPPGSSNVNGTIGNGSTNGNGNTSSNNNNNTNNDDAEMRMDSNGGDRSEKSQRQRDRHGLGHGQVKACLAIGLVWVVFEGRESDWWRSAKGFEHRSLLSKSIILRSMGRLLR